VLDAVLADEIDRVAAAAPDQGMRLAVPTTVALDDLDDEVARSFERALQTLSRQGRADRADRGARISRRRRDEHQGWFCRGGKLCLASLSDRQQGRCLRPPGIDGILRGESISAADYIDLMVARKSLIARAAARLAPYDALVMPTTANTPPRIADLADDKAFTRENLRSLRNCTLINMIDGCAISLPCHREGEVAGRADAASSAGADRRVLELAAGMEAAARV